MHILDNVAPEPVDHLSLETLESDVDIDVPLLRHTVLLTT